MSAICATPDTRVNDIAKRFDVLDAMNLLVMVWDIVSGKTIKNASNMMLFLISDDD